MGDIKQLTNILQVLSNDINVIKELLPEAKRFKDMDAIVGMVHDTKDGLISVGKNLNVPKHDEYLKVYDEYLKVYDEYEGLLYKLNAKAIGISYYLHRIDFLIE